MYDVGLTALRKLFMDIHPTWSNNSADAKSLVKGSMKLKGHELASFNKGDINKWDVSLITTVLLYSKKCNDEISKKPGFEDAIRSIKDYKNKLVSHPHDEKMSDADYQVHWPAISGHLETIGASKEEIDTILKENVLENGKVYRDLFLQEVAAQSAAVEEIRQQGQMVNEKLDTIIANQTNSGQSDIRNQLSPRRGGPNWDEWMKFFNAVRGFDHCQNNYILITDAISSDLMECFSTLRSVPWKMVLDLDSSSEENGMYKDFASKDGKNSLINMITPAEIGRLSIANLARHIDANKTQWMFVNGRESDGSDGGPQDFEDWEDISVKEISAFFKCFSEPEKLDKNKPVVCLVLPFREETADFLDVTIRRLLENFNDFNLNFVEVTPKDQSSAFPEKLRKKLKSKLCTTDLDPDVLCLGLKQLFNISSQQSYRMPSSQAKISAELTQKEYLYLKEYLDVLYEGCEDLPNMTDDETDEEDEDKFDDLIEEHKKSFMSGNWISFLSLSYNHDAKREISNEIRIHIQRLLDQGPTHPSIVEVSHSPGSGGSTIARRVMWDIHNAYPCTFAKLEDHKLDLEDADSAFLNNLAERISFLQDKCNTTPVVLLDGKHARIDALSNRLSRILKSKGKKAVLLRCNHSSGRHKSQNTESSDVHAVFAVNVKLERSSTDLKEFEEKYKDYIQGFKEIKSVSGLSRVFHFPLVAMLEEFREKLQQIVFESFEEMESTEREIIIVVAFLQRYAAQATPAPLLYEAFKNSVLQPELFHRERQGITYEDISKIMPKHMQFWNLMVPAYPAKYIHRGRFKRTNKFQEMYTLKHPVVAELVLKKAKISLERDTLSIARDFLGLLIYEDNRFIPLMQDLFVQNGCGPGRFSLLFEELKRISPQEAGDVFYEAAEKTKDVVVVTSAARFYAKVPPLPFSKAKELIKMAFKCRNAKEKKKTIHDVNGIVLLKEMKLFSKRGKIKSLQELQDKAEEVLRSFRNARTFPPTFPNPLIGEVKTWLTCIDWIAKNHCHGDTDKALEFITSNDAPPFFRSCVNESFHLLNIVDEIVQTVNTLSDPETTQKEANSGRISLMQTFKKGKSDTDDVIKACRALCSVDRFPTSSELELKRLQVQYVFSSRKALESLNGEGHKYLLDLLTELVEVEKDAIFAKHLMRICVLINGYSLDKGLEVCAIWSRNSSYDALPCFYEMMIYFLKILDGEGLELRSNYQEALENCRKKSEYNCRRTMNTHYLSKAGEGMSRLMNRNTLFQGETEYKSPSETPETYWKTNSRKKLLECCGRIRISPSSYGKKNYHIELLQSNIRLHVAKSAGIGEAGPDFTPNSQVYFVVSFNLLGPVANGITFEPCIRSTFY
ncbi:sterile alpha motif domain-containing protein 9-like [Actinia tenebrosa]|uniref:Sterile alpha motif domain-containing protein 9-like n=1 Tax=Actinia tenebrosa TaxID=6105 RepID=A0A6P8J3H7_ACTTE|nr:sterile alpha motif domain-containing protein 9-like [Actinia tenebrosa]